MDRRQAPRKALSVVVQRRHSYDLASLTLTPHYVQLVLNPVASPNSSGAADVELSAPQGQNPRKDIFAAQSGDNIRLSLHLIGRVTRLPSAPVRGAQAMALFPSDEQSSRAIFGTLRTSVVLQGVEQLAAFHPGELSSLTRTAPDPLLDTRAGQFGWSIYDVKKEFERQGVWSRTRAWRTTSLNVHHTFCPTYPSLLVVPSSISDATLQHGAKFRSKSRLPALTYLHWAHLGSITRSSQPLVGLRYSRSVQDEKLVDAIFTSHLLTRDPPAPASLSSSDDGHTAETSLGAFDAIDSSEAPAALNNQPLCGAEPNNVIIDARPTTNAYANHAKGAGSETMDYYPGCTKVFLGIDNIHVMRDSLKAITEALTDADAAPGFSGLGQKGLLELDSGQIKRSGWLKHTTSLLEGAEKIVRAVHVDRAHVLIHCSDGWDRTSQLSALAQVCLDPYFRTYQGFAVLVEKDFASFGHRFLDRTGHLSHGNFFEDKFQTSPVSEQDLEPRNGGFEAAAAASALWGFTKSVAANLRAPQDHDSVTHLKEISPVFHQFLDCVYQLHRQFPDRFEFATDWLVELQRALHECTTGTFLFNSEAERIQYRRRFPGLKSVWNDLLCPATKESFRNSQFDPGSEAMLARTDAGVLMPDGKNVRLWPALFRRSDRDLNSFIELERAAHAQMAAERAARRKRLEERLEAAAQGKTTAASAGVGEGITLMDPSYPEGSAGFAYRPYQPKSRVPSRTHNLPAGMTAVDRVPKTAKDLGSSIASTSDDWDPAAVGKRQVRALWSAGKGWLLGGDQAGESEDSNPWGASVPTSAASSASSALVSAAPPAPLMAPRNRRDSMSSWDANMWAGPASDPLSSDMHHLVVSTPSPPPMAKISSQRSTGSLDVAPVLSGGPLDPLGGSGIVGTRKTPAGLTSNVAQSSATVAQSPHVRPLDQSIAGDPLVASWASRSRRTSTAPRPESPPDLAGRAGLPDAERERLQAHEAHNNSGVCLAAEDKPKVSPRAQVSSDPLGVL